MKLVVVESPNKIPKLKSILRGEYVILPSVGHIRELEEDGYEFKNNKVIPHYKLSAKGNVVSNLKKHAKFAEEIILATDADREGEAIAWHIMDVLGRKYKYKRAEFHSITYPGVMEGMKNLREIDMNLVNAQQSRRILDRIVGFKASESCWKELNDKRCKSAGRVQSVALRMVAERDAEIASFKPVDYSELYINLKCPQSTIEEMILYKIDGKICGHMKNSEIKNIQKTINKKGHLLEISKVETSENKVFSPPCYTTSMIQQDCSNKLNMNPSETMSILQKLFEEGHITYHRTDSVYISKQAIDMSREIIEKQFGHKYLPDTPIFFKNKSQNAQEAHEAIRPTEPLDRPKLDGKMEQVYSLIWKRFVSCQMSPSIQSITTIEAKDSKHIFMKNVVIEVFDGWHAINSDSLETMDKSEKKGRKKKSVETPKSLDIKCSIGEKGTIIKSFIENKQTTPPSHFTQASLIKELESNGIGRPSTYAYIMNKLISNRYVIPKGKIIVINEVGQKIIDLLTQKYKGNFIEVSFTKDMEDSLDHIAQGKLDWNNYIISFHNNFVKYS